MHSGHIRTRSPLHNEILERKRNQIYHVKTNNLGRRSVLHLADHDTRLRVAYDTTWNSGERGTRTRNKIPAGPDMMETYPVKFSTGHRPPSLFMKVTSKSSMPSSKPDLKPEM